MYRMSKMKRLRSLLLLMLAVTLLLGSCTPTQQEPQQTESTTSEETTDPVKSDLVITKGTKLSMLAVLPADASAALKKACSAFTYAFQKHIDVKVKTVEDSENVTKESFEILIGNTNREESQVLSNDLPKKGYRIALMGQKLVFVADCEDALIEALGCFSEQFVKGKTEVKLAGDFLVNGLWSPTILNEGSTKNAVNISIDVTKRHQTIEYMGASGCWVGNVMTYLKDHQLAACMDLLYNRDTGIGLNSYRYNIGGGAPMTVRGEELKSTTSLETAPNSGEYSLSLDANSVTVMDMAIARGAEYLTLFINSPPTYMTYSGYTAGNTDGSSNLRTECYQDFAEYAVDIVELFLENGYKVQYISPINEPSWGWGDSEHVWQEGCHYTVEQIFEVDLLVAKELQKRNIEGVKVSFPETASWNTIAYAIPIVNRLKEDPSLIPYIDHFACHSYSTSREEKIAFKKLWVDSGFGDIPLHQTEWCSGTTGLDAAMEISKVLHEDFTILECNAWEFWVGMMVDDYSLIKVSENSYLRSKRLWAFGNYSKFITGATRVRVSGKLLSDDIFASAYINEEKGEIYLIVTNDSDQNAKMNLSDYDGKLIQVWETSEANGLTKLGYIDSSYSYTLPAKSITTFVIQYQS